MNKRIFKNIISCIMFLIILLVLFCKITWLFRGNWVEAREDVWGFKNQGNVDVVLVGGSTLLRFYIPLQAYKETGITSYNYATSSAKFDILKEYIEDSRKTNEAKLYVINVRTIALLEQEVDELSLRNWSDSLEPTSLVRVQGINDFVYSRDWDIEKLPAFYFDIIKYHSNKDALSSEKQWSFMNLRNIYNWDKGFDPNRDHVPFEEPERIYDSGILTNQQERAVDELLDYCDKNKLNALFVCCPYVITQSDWLIMNAVGEKITDRGYSYVNFNDYYDEIGLDFETDFGDDNHVNFLGAEKYTNYLIDYISKHYDLPDHRSDEKYKRWDEDYEIYVDYQTEWKDAITATVESHLNAKKVGELLKKKTDFYDWYSCIRDPNYSVIIKINEIPSEISINNPFYLFWEDYGLNQFDGSYIGLWKGDRVILATSEETVANFNVGTDGGRGTVPCSIELDTNKVIIGDSDCSINESGIQVLVYDNNYQKLLDNVLLCINENETVEIQRQ